ncbi:MAG: thiamine pyrophosphate-dependent enzyme [Chloroflexota bacterium]
MTFPPFTSTAPTIGTADGSGAPARSPARPAARAAIDHVRDTCTPAALILHTYRFSAHSKGDDPRDRQEIARIRSESDPISIQASRLSSAELQQIEQDISVLIDQSFTRAFTDPFPMLDQTQTT